MITKQCASYIKLLKYISVLHLHSDSRRVSYSFSPKHTTSFELVLNHNIYCSVKIPETLTSLQVPFTSTFPSGQVHLAPVGLSKHMKSQDILKHGFGPVEKTKAFNKKDFFLFVKKKKMQLFFFRVIPFMCWRVLFLEVQHMNNFTSASSHWIIKNWELCKEIPLV